MEKPRKGIYYLLIWKKGIRILTRFFVTLLVTGVILILGTLAIFAASRKEKSLLPRVQVAVTVLDGNMATTMAVQMVGEMDAVRNVCDFRLLSKEEAQRAVRDGTVQASIYLTEDLYQDVNHGVNTPVLVEVAKDSSLGLQLFKDLINVGVSMLQIGEANVYTLDEISEVYEMNVSVSDLMDTIADNYLNLAFNRNSVWITTMLSPYGNISMMGFYSITVALAVVCLLFGTGFSGLYDQKEHSVDVCLARMGITTVTRSLARLLVETFVNWLLLIIVLLPALYFTNSAELSVSMVSTVIPGLIPIAFSVAAFIHLVNSFAVGDSGNLFYLIISILLFVLGGGLFPAAYLPPALYRISSVLPIGFWQRYLSDLLWNGFSVSSLAGVLLFGTGMAVLGGIGLKINENK
ncbi:MAG: ABC transporter permease [Blautia sp.]|nr:ABC transporter permease [Blautia sp.]